MRGSKRTRQPPLIPRFAVLADTKLAPQLIPPGKVVTSLYSCYSVCWPSYTFSNAAICLDAVNRSHP